ncbi:type IV secretion system protein [Salmonella enterica]|nr:type IV secretion system protein [Salmonella enterica]
METSNLQLYSWLYAQFDSVLTGYIAQTSGQIVGAITPVAYIMFGIYIVLWGFSMVRGLIDEPVPDGLFRLLKIALILGFALNTGRYQTEVVEFFMRTPDAMANTLALRGTAASGDLSTFQTLDTLINRVVDVARTAWNEAGVFNGNMGMYLAAAMVLVFGLLFCAAAGIIVLVGKIAMVLLLALGPIFILMTMFKTTQRFFDAWLGQVINYMLLLVLALAVVTMFLSIMEIVVQNAGDKMMAKSTLEAIATITLVSICCTALLFQVGPIASALAGGVALATTAAVGRAVGSGVSAAGKGMAMGKAGAIAGAKLTGGATLVAAAAARSVGGMFRASNAIRRG